MARSRKDGRRGGGHHNTQNREYWTPRGYPRFRMMEPGRIAKVLTHRLERRQAKAAVRLAVVEVATPTEEQDND